VTLHGQALVVTADPSGCGEQLVRELRGEYETEWAAEAGRVASDAGECQLHSWPDALRLDAYAETEAGLSKIEGAVKSAIERTGSAEHLRVEWYRRPNS
jgi:hypothetical protein